MARQTTVAVVADTWTQLTNAVVTEITFQNVSVDDNYVYIKATTDTSAPTTTDGAYLYGPGEGEVLIAMTDLFPGLSGANRVWAYSVNGGSVAVSHA